MKEKPLVIRVKSTDIKTFNWKSKKYTKLKTAKSVGKVKYWTESLDKNNKLKIKIT